MATTKVNVSKISDFPKVTPAGTDYLLVEKDGQGGSITLSQIPVSTPVNDKITEEVNKLNSQINDLAFEPGDTTGDAELRNIRTPADGFTVPEGTNAGGAVRAQVTQLDEKISNLKGDFVQQVDNLEAFKSCINIVPLSIVRDEYAVHDGSFASFVGWSRTDYIFVKKGESIKIKTDVASAYNNVYDADKTFLYNFTVEVEETNKL